MQLVSLSFGWLAYVEFREGVVGSVAGNRSKQLMGPLLKWMVPQIDGTIIFFAKFNWKVFSNWMLEMHFLKNVYNSSELS